MQLWKGDLLKKGFYGSSSKWDGSELERLDIVTVSLDQDAIRLFVDFLREETEYGTKIIFVQAPFYIKIYDKMKDADRLYATFDSITSVFNIPFLDYSHADVCYDTAYFYNAMHLNKEGADLFTSQLAHDLDSLDLIK